MHTWAQVAFELMTAVPHARVRVARAAILHPKSVGFVKSIGLPAGQRADWRCSLPNGQCLHVHEHRTVYVAHVDQIDPARDALGHLAVDAPGLTRALCAGIGAWVGAHTSVGPLRGAWMGLGLARHLARSRAR